jgi:hypothetical protein
LVNVKLTRKKQNWFQNRRAKAKQEKKQIEFGLREAGPLAYSEPSSPEHFNPTGYFDSHFQSPENHLVSFSPGNGGSAPIASYHPHYENSTAATLNSLERTLIAAEAAVTRGEFDGEYQDQHSNENFGGPLPYDGYHTADRAQFPVANPNALCGFEYNNEIFVEQQQAQPIMLQEPQAPQGFGCYVNGSEEQHAMVQASVPTFPSQLLVGHGDQDRTPRPFQPQSFEEVEEGTGFQSPPSSVESRFKSPPPPADIAARRSKPRPAALGTSALRDKTSTGPKTSNNAEAVKRLHGSPSTAMRRVSSANGLNVLAGRVQKSSQMPLRSPLKRNFTTGTPSMEQPHIKVPMRNRSWLSTPRGPPTPRSPRDMLLTQGLVLHEEPMQQDEGSQREGQTPQDQNTPSSSSQSESDGSYMFERPIPGCFTTHGLMNNMASPPETPGNPNGVIHWGYEVPDDALLTPGFGTFDGMMPQPHYVSPLTASQPPTPAFGGHFNGFPFAHHSPVFEMVPAMDSGATEYCFPDNGLPYPMVASTKASPEQPREKTYTFNNATQKDFESS